MYYIVIAMKNNILIGGETGHPEFEGLTFVEVDESGAYKYSIIEKDLKNLNLVPTNVTTRILVVKSNEGFNIVGLDEDNLIKISNFNSGAVFSCVLDENYELAEGVQNAVVTIKMNNVELLSVNLVNGECSITILKEKLKEAFINNDNIEVSVVGITQKTTPTEP